MAGSRSRTALMLAVTVGLVAGAVGCKSTKKVDETFPKTVEATVEAKQSEPDRIGFLEVKPWSVNPGEKIDVTMGATPGRKASVMVTPLDGGGAARDMNLASKDAQTYGGTFDTTGLTPGRYRVEGVLTGGPSGEPVKLVSSRAFTINAPPPPPPPPKDVCVEAKEAFAQPRVHFAYDKSDLDADSKAWINEVAGKIAQLGSRVGQVTIEGHCDERGTINYNLALGGRRANAVKAALLKTDALKNLKGLKIDTLSKGKEQPLVPNASTEEDHAKNRRAVFILECTPAQ